jgi:hypothetical protein
LAEAAAEAVPCEPTNVATTKAARVTAAEAACMTASATLGDHRWRRRQQGRKKRD